MYSEMFCGFKITGYILDMARGFMGVTSNGAVFRGFIP